MATLCTLSVRQPLHFLAIIRAAGIRQKATRTSASFAFARSSLRPLLPRHFECKLDLARVRCRRIDCTSSILERVYQVPKGVSARSENRIVI